MTSAVPAAEPEAGLHPDAADRETRFGIWLLAAGTVGLLVAVVLLVEKIALIQDPSYVPTCSLNPVLSCGSIMESVQAELFGFPNPILGIAGFPVLIVTGAALLAGARLARWYWVALQAGVTAAMVLVGWLIFQSLYRIGALCPYCMVVWVVVIPTFWYLTLRNLERGRFGRKAARSKVTRGLVAWHAPLLLGVYLLVIALIAIEFWDYWSTLG